MFKIYDLNMNEIPFPEGVKPLDIFVSSVNKRRLTEEFEGRSGALNYGYDYGERSVDLSLWLEAHDTIDYRLIRNELYAFFDTHDVFYIEETRVPSRVLKVTIDESYIPERINQTHSSVEISCRTLDSVFWESKYTTLELHDSGYSATAEKYGLVDNIDDEKVKYRFEPQSGTLVFDDPEGWENGSINSVSGILTDSETVIRTKNYTTVVPGETYELEETLDAPGLRQWWIAEYDNNNDYIGFASTPWSGPAEMTFVARGSKIKIRSGAVDGHAFSPSDIGNNITPKVTGKKVTQSFTVYNAGNVTIEPESMYLNIFATYVKSTGDFTIRNKTTGEEIILKRNSNRNHFRINGMVPSFGSITNIFRDTNRRFISLASGDNEIEVTNGTFEEIRFNFKYLYK